MQGVQLDALAINFDQQSTLARLLAKENITVIHGTYKTAWFDPERRVLALPLWKNKGKAVYDLLTGHEVGHALYTPAKGWHDAVDDIDGAPKGYLNVLEDVRIERKVQDRYPGLRFQFQKAYKQLADDDFFGLNKGDIDMNMVRIIDKINVKSKLGQHVDVVFDDDERDFYHRAFKTETFEDVVALAKEIYAYQKMLEQQFAQDTPINVSSSEDGEYGEDDSFEEADNDYEKPEPNQAAEQPQEDKAEEEKQEDGVTGRGRQEDGIQKELGKDDVKDAFNNKKSEDIPDEALDSLTDKAFREREKELVADNLGGVSVFTINKCKQKDIIIDYKEYYDDWNKHIVSLPSKCPDHTMAYINERVEKSEEKFKKFKQDTEMAAAYMAKEFEMRKAAYQYSRSSLQKTGIINTNKLHAYKYSEDIFLKSTKLANYKNHGMMLFIDFSGSMSENMGPTIRQMLNLSAFCRMINVPFEVYAFTTRVRADDEGTKYWNMYNDSEVILQQFNLMNLMSSRMTRKEFNDGMHMLYKLSLVWDGEIPGYYLNDWNQLHSTPLNTCIVYAHELVNEFKNKNNVEKMTAMFLTDGESDSFQVRQSDVAREHYMPSHDGYSWRGRKAIVRFRNKNFTVKSMYGSDVTSQLLKSLKNDTNSNVLGFFISEYRNQAVARACEAHDWSERSKVKDKYTTQMNKNRCLIEDNIFGYDRYFGLCTKYIDIAEDDFDELVEDGASKTKIKTAFAKATKSRRVNRILLNAFVDAIA